MLVNVLTAHAWSGSQSGAHTRFVDVMLCYHHASQTLNQQPRREQCKCELTPKVPTWCDVLTSKSYFARNDSCDKRARCQWSSARTDFMRARKIWSHLVTVLRPEAWSANYLNWPRLFFFAQPPTVVLIGPSPHARDHIATVLIVFHE